MFPGVDPQVITLEMVVFARQGVTLATRATANGLYVASHLTAAEKVSKDQKLRSSLRAHRAFDHRDQKPRVARISSKSRRWYRIST